MRGWDDHGQDDHERGGEQDGTAGQGGPDVLGDGSRTIQVAAGAGRYCDQDSEAESHPELVGGVHEAGGRSSVTGGNTGQTGAGEWGEREALAAPISIMGTATERT